ncbi:MAG: SRPBCC family protein [Bacteroidales bacterium]|nr:SRPBCC family protein [Bacteroidales bacterium]
MTDFTSDIKQIPHNQTKVFDTLSDLNNLARFGEKLPTTSIKDLSFDRDSCRFKVDNVGSIALRIIEREPCKTIKLVSESSPIPFTCWIQLVGAGENETRLKLTVRADIPLLLKPMVAKPLEKGIGELANVLAALPY